MTVRRLRSHVLQNAVGYVALFVALTGTSYAAIRLPRDSVTAKQLAPKSVGASELKDNAVTSRKVAGLELSDFKAGQLNSLNSKSWQGQGSPGPDGPPGPPGPTGATGSAGPPGVAGLAQLAYAFGINQNPGLLPVEVVAVVALCPSGESVTGGAVDTTDAVNQIVRSSHPFDGDDGDDVPDDGWEGIVYNFDDANTPAVDVYSSIATAICGPTDSVSLSG
jgi:hypothetical protein